jgi:8-hydroxy-5-deazaflavin:NADPH oxidoreductase
MKVGILGSGLVGQTLGAGFVKHGHQVFMGTRNPDDEDVRKWVAATKGASAGTFAEAAAFGELLVLVVLGRIAATMREPSRKFRMSSGSSVGSYPVSCGISGRMCLRY